MEIKFQTKKESKQVNFHGYQRHSADVDFG